jgi:uncharacterized DUF497 family protein
MLVDASRFEWDPNKDRANDEKHGITFLEAITVFLDPHVIEEDSTRPEHGELRRKAVGSVRVRMVAVIFTLREDRRRIISARRARPDERKRYDQGASIV